MVAIVGFPMVVMVVLPTWWLIIGCPNVGGCNSWFPNGYKGSVANVGGLLVGLPMLVVAIVGFPIIIRVLLPIMVDY